MTTQGRVLRRNEKLESCGVTDGCTIQVTSRMRGGGGRHKDKRNKAEKKRGRCENGQEDQVEIVGGLCPEMTQSQKDVVIQMLERNEGYREIIKMISETG